MDSTPKPTLSIVADGTVNEPAQITPAPRPTPQPITVESQARKYAILAYQLKKETHLGDGAVTKIIELALNERFTLLQMGLAKPTPDTQAEDPDGS